MLLLASALVFAATALSSQEISAAGPLGPLKGTWTKASDATAPIVLIIRGSGPTDRDGNSPLGINAGTYPLLAEGLGRKESQRFESTSGACSEAQALFPTPTQ